MSPVIYHLLLKLLNNVDIHALISNNKLIIPCKDTYLVGCSTLSHCILSGLIIIHAHRTETKCRTSFPRFCVPSLLAERRKDLKEKNVTTLKVMMM